MAKAENWMDILLEAARQSYASSQQGIILSRIPSILRQSGIEKDDIFSEGRKLRELIATEAGAHLRLVQNEESPLDWAILPHDLKISEPHSKYFPSLKEPSTGPSPKRFISTFWQGFTRHVPNGHKRWLFRGQQLSIEDRVGAGVPESAVEIERMYTAKPDELVIASSEVMTRIEAWANAHKIDPNEFLVKSIDLRHPPITKSEGHSLASMIKAMTTEDLARVTIPLDIVARYLASSKDK